MTQQGVRWTADQVLALAPDDASRRAAGRLGAAGPWSGTGQDGGTVWGLCGGSGGGPYRTVVDLAGGSGPAYRCSCPSRKLPCKHALGLLLLWASAADAVPPGQPPDWAAERPATGRERPTANRPGGGAGSGSGAADPEAARHRAERRAERITAGAGELEQRLADLLRAGLAGAEQAGYGLWEETAARMVDAQASGLASRVRELGAIPSSGSDWPVRLLEESALLHLLNRAWLRRALLPDDLAATVRSRVGLPATPSGPPVRDRWLVLAQYDTSDSRLTTRRIWLYGAGSQRTALLLSYGAAGRAPELALPVGLTLDAEVSPYPGRVQRAALGERFAAPVVTQARPAGVSTARAVARYGAALRDDPWLDSVPVTLDRVVPTPDGDAWQLADADGDTALPLTPAARSRPGLWRLVALSGGAPVRVFGECGHQGFTPLTAWPEKGGAAVPLC
ncbi:SWIM zinc finger domain-containing protein [Streptomyces sp. DH24]|uniref:SWIM zinc finger domain-containing protein n=1 Tax=Streptomyces sp. DH24 TaxID=3040123 RepID=UPI0024415CB4|nr:SWIM zinc finger domain-containing protein [Streptomyces sp. DH24]MDG9716859.1 SWIM zinc finger domain-containing protein [Streptomyces sp. DH24]